MGLRKSALNFAKKMVAKLEGCPSPDTTSTAAAPLATGQEPCAAFGGTRHLVRRSGGHSRAQSRLRHILLGVNHRPNPTANTPSRHMNKTPQVQTIDTVQAGLGLFDGQGKCLIVPIAQHARPSGNHSDTDRVDSELSGTEVQALLAMNQASAAISSATLRRRHSHSRGASAVNTELPCTEMPGIEPSVAPHPGLRQALVPRSESSSSRTSTTDCSSTAMDSEELQAYARMGAQNFNNSTLSASEPWDDRVAAPDPAAQELHRPSPPPFSPPTAPTYQANQWSMTQTPLPARYSAYGVDLSDSSDLDSSGLAAKNTDVTTPEPVLPGQPGPGTRPQK
jgi:hypothetical protein